MYGPFLSPLRSRRRLKLLEIGLGCDMDYGPGASVALWRSYFGAMGEGLELWMAEYDAACADKYRHSHGGGPGGYRTLVGDQGDAETVRRWVRESGSSEEAGGTPFDVVVDDGSHRNADILTSFSVLWPRVAAGGLYFIEDLQVGRSAQFQNGGAAGGGGGTDDSDATPVVADVVHDWLEQLLIDPRIHRRADGRVIAGGRDDGDEHVQRQPLPEGLAFVHCVDEACVFGKRTQLDTRPDNNYFFVRPLGCWAAEAPVASASPEQQQQQQQQQQGGIIPTLEGLDERLDGTLYAERADAVQKCAEAAKARGFNVFVLQDGGWCGSSAEAPKLYRTHGRSKACVGDGRGGRGANDAYELLHKRPPPSQETAWYAAAVAGAHEAPQGATMMS